MDWFGRKARREAEIEARQREYRDYEMRMAEIAADRARADMEHAERIEKLRAATETAERARHQQQLELLEAVLSRVQSISEGGQQVMAEVAKGIQDNAKAINTWMELFQHNQGDGDVHTVRNEDEFKAWQQRELQQMQDMGYLTAPATSEAELPPQALQTITGMFANDRG